MMLLNHLARVVAVVGVFCIVGAGAPDALFISDAAVAEVRSQDGLPTLLINRKPVFPMAIIPINDFPTAVIVAGESAGGVHYV